MVKPGSVSLLALCHDSDNQVEVWIDRSVWGDNFLQCHPLENTATCLMSTQDLECFFQYTGHYYQLIDIPETE